MDIFKASLARWVLRRFIHLPFIPLCLEQHQLQAAGEDVAAPLCCAQGLSPCSHRPFINGSRRNLDAILSKSAADQENPDTAPLATGSFATRARWKRVVSPSNTSTDSSMDVGLSSVSSNGVSSADATQLCSLPTPSFNITSSTYPTPNSTQPSTTSLMISTLFPFSTCIPQTPFTLTTSTETLTTISATLPSSTSPIGLSATLTSTDAGTSFQSIVTVITLSTVLPSSLTMSNPDTISLPPANPTSTVIDSTLTQSTSDTILISSTSSTSFLTSTSFSLTFLSSTFFSPTPIPSTSDFPTPIVSLNPSISAITSSSISMDDSTITSTSSLVGTQTITVSSTVLSTGTPHNTGFAHRTGAIIGVGIAGTFVLLLVVVLIFFACKRCRSVRPYNSSSQDILTATRNPSWHPPLEADDDEHYLATYGHPVSPNYLRTSDDRPNDHLFIEDSNADANGTWPVFGGQLPVPPLAQGLTNSKGPILSPSGSSNHTFDSSRRNTEPLNINKRISSQQLRLTVDSHVTAIGSRSGVGGSSSSNEHTGPGSPGEALLPGVNKRTFITEPRPIHTLSERRHHSTPPTTFVYDPSPEHATQRIQQYQEEQNQQDRAYKTVSQVILARLRASRRPSATPTVKTHSQSMTIGSEESQAPSYLYSPSLLNPPISISPPQNVPRLYVPSITLNQIPHPPSPVQTDASSMVEGLLHPRLGMALASSQQASATSLRDHEDYTRPINGLVNNRFRSTTTFETQDTSDLSGEGA